MASCLSIADVTSGLRIPCGIDVDLLRIRARRVWHGRLSCGGNPRIGLLIRLRTSAFARCRFFPDLRLTVAAKRIAVSLVQVRRQVLGGIDRSVAPMSHRREAYCRYRHRNWAACPYSRHRQRATTKGSTATGSGFECAHRNRQDVSGHLARAPVGIRILVAWQANEIVADRLREAANDISTADRSNDGPSLDLSPECVPVVRSRIPQVAWRMPARIRPEGRPVPRVRVPMQGRRLVDLAEEASPG